MQKRPDKNNNNNHAKSIKSDLVENQKQRRADNEEIQEYFS